MAENYEITQEDIDTMVRGLKFTHPEYATPDVARIVLEYNRDFLLDLAEGDPALANRVAEVSKAQSEKRAQKWTQRDGQ